VANILLRANVANYLNPLMARRRPIGRRGAYITVDSSSDVLLIAIIPFTTTGSIAPLPAKHTQSHQHTMSPALTDSTSQLVEECFVKFNESIARQGSSSPEASQERPSPSRTDLKTQCQSLLSSRETTHHSQGDTSTGAGGGEEDTQRSLRFHRV
jgi:hypothetical protein